MRGNVRGSIPSFFLANLTDEDRGLVAEILTNSCISMRIDNIENRSSLVGFQGRIERNIVAALIETNIKASVCIIHTKLPPTPLRASVSDEVEDGLVASMVSSNPVCLSTVTERSAILRHYLAQGGRLVAAYQQNSLDVEIKGLNNFQDLCKAYTENLINFPHTHEASDSGASYLIQDQEGNITFFAIQANQANNPGALMSLWLGQINLCRDAAEEVTPALIRFREVDKYLQDIGINMQDQLTLSQESIEKRVPIISKDCASELSF